MIVMIGQEFKHTIWYTAYRQRREYEFDCDSVAMILTPKWSATP